MKTVTLSQADYALLQTVVRNAELVYQYSQMLRGLGGGNPVQTDMAMVQLRQALDAAQTVKVIADADSKRTRTTQTRRR